MKFFEAFGEFLEKYLDHSESWKRSHLESIGEIEARSPWRETNYRHESGWCITHWENIVTPPHMSMHSPRHVWKISSNRIEEGWVISLSYGIAPYKHEKGFLK